MRRSREMIAIVVLASALAADGAMGAPRCNQTTGASTMASRLVQRISVGLRRSIASTRILESRCLRGSLVDRTASFTPQTVPPIFSRTVPGHLPLPPPAI